MASITQTQSLYRGRFAPSPTGPLHFGSLIAALASYLCARAQQGKWLVRIEDLDPPREQPGASKLILETLEAYHLFWDEPVVYQSQRHDIYEHYTQQLLNENTAFYCQLSRQELAKFNGIHPGLDINLVSTSTSKLSTLTNPAPAAIRMITNNKPINFTDEIQGLQQQNLSKEVGAFVIKRKDGLYAYQLAVVIDDDEQGITHIVRGSDLLDSTPRQRHLQEALNFIHPCYAHIPIIVNGKLEKLSKQTFAKGLNPKNKHKDLFTALQILAQSPPKDLLQESYSTLLSWAIEHWKIEHIPAKLHFPHAESSALANL